MSAPGARASGHPPLSTATYYALTFVTLCNFLNYIDRFVLAAVLPRIKTDLHLTDAQLGLLANAFLVSYFATSPFFGRMGDRGSRSAILGVAVGFWSLTTAAAGLARNFVQLVLARASVGIGEAAYSTISPGLLADYFPPERRGRAFAIFYMATPVGAALGFVLGGLLERSFGWRGAFYAVGLPGLVLAALVLLVRDPPRGAQDDEVAVATEGLMPDLRTLVRNSTYVGTVLGYAAYTFALSGLAIWMPTYLERIRGFELTEANFFVGALTVAAGLCGTFVGGLAGDRIARRVKHGYLWLCGATTLAAAGPAWVALTAPARLVYQPSFFAAEFLLFLSSGPINVVVVSAVPAGMRALAMAMCIFTIQALGGAISPPFIGLMADWRGLASAVSLVPLSMAVAGLVWIATALRTPDPISGSGSPPAAP
jgi:MFS family permease